MAYHSTQTIKQEADEIFDGSTNSPDQNFGTFLDNARRQTTDTTSTPYFKEEIVPQSNLENIKLEEYFTTSDNSPAIINSHETASNRLLSAGVDVPPVVLRLTVIKNQSVDRHIYPYVIYSQSNPLPESSAAFSTISHEGPFARYNTDSYQCDICHKKCFRKSGLTQHKKIAHGKPRPFRCSQCGKSYENQSQLMEHRDKHVAENKPYACGLCGRRFVYKIDLSRHRCNHTTRRYQCSVFFCGRSFTRLDHWQAHEQSHKTRNQTILKCGRLPKRFDDC